MTSGRMRSRIAHNAAGFAIPISSCTVPTNVTELILCLWPRDNAIQCLWVSCTEIAPVSSNPSFARFWRFSRVRAAPQVAFASYFDLPGHSGVLPSPGDAEAKASFRLGSRNRRHSRRFRWHFVCQSRAALAPALLSLRLQCSAKPFLSCHGQRGQRPSALGSLCTEWPLITRQVSPEFRRFGSPSRCEGTQNGVPQTGRNL